jgi:hypothetical protein
MIDTYHRAYPVFTLRFNFLLRQGALDTHCIDKESSIPLLNSTLTLFDLTGEAHYLKWAERAAYYPDSGQWHHTIRYPAGTALHALQYDTFGSTAVSTRHPHQDPYGLLVCSGFFQTCRTDGQRYLETAGAVGKWYAGDFRRAKDFTIRAGDDIRLRFHSGWSPGPPPFAWKYCQSWRTGPSSTTLIGYC